MAQQGLEPSLTPAAPLDGGPLTEQAPPETGQAPASKPGPVNVSALQAGLTRHSQQNAAAKKALGLPTTATTDQLIAAIEGLRTPPQQVDSDSDPEYDARWVEMREREYATAARVHTPEAVATVREIEALALQGGSPIELTDAVIELARQLAKQMNGQAPQQAAKADPVQTPTHDIAPEGDGPRSWTVQLEQDEPGSGNIEGAAQKLFAMMGRRR